MFLSPDGHGGMLAALESSGCLDQVHHRGIKYLFYGQIDNPLVQLCDPATIGYHILGKSEMTTQVVRKNDPLQRVGNVASIDDKMNIIEYSDLPDDIAAETGDDGTLRLWAGNIAVHVFDVAFLDRMASQSDSLPFHIARKKVAFVDSNGNKVDPENANAIKFEKFIFDLLPHAENAIVVEINPADGFAAVKNAAGEKTETAATSKKAISDQHRRWLAKCGVKVGDGVAVEINPKFALDADELAGKVDSATTIEAQKYFS